MSKNIKLIIASTLSEKDKYLIEAEIDVLPGVININISYKSRVCLIEFDDDKITTNEIIRSIEQLGYEVLEQAEKDTNIKEHTYFFRAVT